MGFIGRGVIVFLCTVGCGYSAWLIYNCCKRRQKAVGRATRTGYSARFDWIIELIAGVTFLVVVAGLLFVSASGSLPHPDRPFVDASYRDTTRQITGMCPLPSGRLSYDNRRPGRPIAGADLNGLPITDDDVRVFLRNVPEVEWLNLTGTKITDACLADLNHAPKLSALCLGHASVTDSGLAHLARNENLQILSLVGTQTTNKGLAALRGLSNLEVLDLQLTAVTDASLESIRQFPRLKSLNLTETAVPPRAKRNLEKTHPGLIGR